MSASSKFNLSSSSPDRPLYASGQRGSYASASLDRSGSFRENMENPILSTLPNMTRCTSTITQTDVINFFQCLRFDPKAMVTEHKLNRHIDFKRFASLALGMPVEDSPLVSSKGKLSSSSFPEEARRLKAGLRESCTKARERVKIFTESLSVINKCFPSIPSRKRSRSDVLSNERPNLSDRSVSGAGIAKLGTQSGYELELQKSEERTKSSVPNKRTRTSMVDLRPEVRASTPSRPSGNMDRDREILRLPNGSTVQGEEHTSSIAVEGWEKSKMKKKRSGIKPDTTGGSSTSKPIDGHREPKQGLQSRLTADGNLRFNDTHGFRLGVAPGGVGIGKADGVSQKAPLEVRSSMSKVDQDSSLHLIDRRDRPIGSEQERVKIRAIKNKTKAAAREFTSTSPTSSTKMNSAARAPRSVSGVSPKLSPLVQQASAANDWEVSHCTSRYPSAVGTGNRKRTPSMRSSSPPVAQWASQRPQKISRPARRANFPIVHKNDEIPSLDSTSDVLSNGRRLSGSSPQQVKLKSDHFSSAASESEESGAAEIKSKDRSNRSDEVDEKAGVHVQKMSLLLPPKKSKRASGEDHGDGIRRQGRTGRGFTSTRTPIPLMVGKLGVVGTAKQLRSSRHSLDKTESKAGRPPTRKLADRKAYKRQKQATMNGSADFLVGSDDGHEELLTAASAVTNTAQALSGLFWKQMEPLFRFISEIDTAFLRQQVNHETNLAGPVSDPFDADGSSLVPNGFGLNEFGGNINETQCLESTLDRMVSGKSKPKDISLYQRVMAALIPEDLYCSGNEDLSSDSYQSGFEMEMNSESDASCAQILYDSETSKYPASNRYMITASGGPFDNLEQVMAYNNVTSASDNGDFLNYDHSQKCLLPQQQTTPDFVCSEYQYNEMSIDEKLLLEIHCIGIYPQMESDLAHTGDGEISVDMSRLDEKHQEMVSKKKEMLEKLLNSAAETREFQEKEFEQHALDKLVEMAYKKYMSCRRGPNAHGAKGAIGKMAKQAALTLVKRTLDRCQEFEVTGKSCFSEPLYKDMFLSAISRLSDRQTDSNSDGEAAKSYFSPQQSPSLSQDILYEANLSSEASRVKRRELEDVLGTSIGVSSGAFSGVGSSLSSSAKGKRSERDREGKGNGREASSRGGSIKIGRPSSSNVKGERKPKSKTKLKTTQLSTSVNGLLGKMSEQPKVSGSSIVKSSDIKDKNDHDFDELEDPIDLSGLQLPGMDVLGVPDDLDGQGQDIGSWLNFDDDGLQDHNDFMGLEIPMDDLSDLNMMV
ncbi:uncharacterized protein [Nicotiana tomentosiformis]|uniref:uncharacterized protein n=1 Tax=Nicotiana tomentosiformis TaxID=4098 RepID=UPI00051B6961|nr:uncharacterized protein LOC104098661 [Nicotiana tomentosiformis]XP_009603746.1 uncharacterized protein LOC104098661 [Nicotiana tomentosiformis]XP_018627129.1 uncharacterized protein LOC104098661 [Nicotiana tomentosiformis]